MLKFINILKLKRIKKSYALLLNDFEEVRAAIISEKGEGIIEYKKANSLIQSIDAIQQSIVNLGCSKYGLEMEWIENEEENFEE